MQSKLTSFLQLFAQQIKATPNAIAITYNGRSLTYKTLDQRANQMAHYLKKLNVAPSDLVGIYLKRSEEMLVCLLAVFKTGAAYVPLDPKYPKERLSFILQETDVAVVLTQSSLLKDMEPLNVIGVPIDSPNLQLNELSIEFSSIESNIESLAYVIYTSGSTGQPKGVPMTHSSIAYYLTAISQNLSISEEDNYLHTASMAFSSSVRQFLVPLIHGAKIVVADSNHTNNPISLFQLINKEKITVFDTVASVWRYGVLALESASPEHKNLLKESQLKTLLFSGGLLPCKLLHQVRDQFDQVLSIFNLYGQTETLGVCVNTIAADFQQVTGNVPVGQLYSHNQAYIVDESFELVESGGIGELCIVGNHLTPGYLKRESANFEKFIPNPFKLDSSERLFKTGDVARQLPNGDLEILGRTDFQVKIRGMRVEVDEVARLIERDNSVKEAVVSSYVDSLGESSLIAYIVPQNYSKANKYRELHQQLQSSLKQILPDYMIPSTFMELEALPLTPNGKLNRLGLPKPKQLSITSQTKDDLVQSSSESQLIKICERLLDIQNVSVLDNFFDIGGHSLLAITFCNEVKNQLDLDLSITDLLQSKNLQELASRLSEPNESKPSSVTFIKPSGSKLPAFFINSVSQARTLATCLDSEQPLHALNIFGIRSVFQETQTLPHIEILANYFIQDLKSIQPNGPYQLIGYCQDGALTLEVAQQLQQQGDDIKLVCLIDSIFKLSEHRISHRLRNLRKFRGTYVAMRLSSLLEKIPGLNHSKRSIEELSTKERLVALESTKLDQKLYQDYLNLSKQFEPKPFSGRMILVHSTEWRFQDFSKVEALASQGLETYEIDALHSSLFKKPYVWQLAKQLSHCLSQPKPIIKISPIPVGTLIS